jgi:hypothetical protein
VQRGQAIQEQPFRGPNPQSSCRELAFCPSSFGMFLLASPKQPSVQALQLSTVHLENVQPNLAIGQHFVGHFPINSSNNIQNKKKKNIDGKLQKGRSHRLFCVFVVFV